MHFQESISIQPETAFDAASFQSYLEEKFQVNQPGKSYVVRKRSIDARGRKVRVHVVIDFYVDEVPPTTDPYLKPKNVSNADPVIIVGAGPAGLFAALELINHGLKPVIIERGKDVQARRRDLVDINQRHKVNADSNYCFGEGGAGTYSDGKLYTRSKKRGDVQKVLDLLVHFGAREDIRYDAHPHIGTNKLPQLIEEIRKYILEAGGQILFETRVTDFLISSSEVKGVETASGEKINGIAVILATGHSARDIFTLLQKKNIHLEQKPFAIGLRVEHPQELINSLQYGKSSKDSFLPAAPYSLVAQTTIDLQKRGVFSFCMCPGGFIVPSATADGEVVVNGMSPSRRDSKYANSGIVVSISNEDVKETHPLANMDFQKQIEQQACLVGGGTQAAPAQRLVDFMDKRISSSLPASSYQPGLTSIAMDDLLMEQLNQRLRFGFKEFGKKMKGYLTNEAVLVGVESRTSSPVRIPRDPDSYEHVEVKRFYPCGEGAGYAGGIVSAAIDGMNCASKFVLKYSKSKDQE
jgi:uncharacterized FAD-dependent dehydrogenase